jgi:hypothetical protein
MSTLIEIPYNNIPGVGIFYGNQVPPDAANIAYVQTSVPAPADVIAIADDLEDPTKYAGNSLIGSVKAVTIQNGVVVDPLTGTAYVALTDDVLFTTVTAPIQTGPTTVNVPLFYCQELRYPIQVGALPTAMAQAFAAGIPPGATSYVPPVLQSLGSYVTITAMSGDPLPTGYVWQALPYKLIGGSLYLRLYTNFRSSVQAPFAVSWAGYQETLNVHPVFFQSKNLASDHVYTETKVYGSGSLTSATAATSGSPTVSIALSATPPAALPQTFNVTESTTVQIQALQTYSDSTISIGVTNASPSYSIGGSAGLQVFPAAPTFYPLTAAVAPTSSGSALSLNIIMSATGDVRGNGMLNVELINAAGSTVWGPIKVYSSNTLSWWNQSATVGSYNWVITPTVDTTLGQQIPGLRGTFTYPLSYSGSYSYPIVATTSFNIVPGTSATYPTPATTVAPTGAAVQLSLAVIALSVPRDNNGTTSYNISLVDPNGVTQQTWSRTASGTLTYSNALAIGGSWSWVIQATGTALSVAAETYNVHLSGVLGYYVPNSSNQRVYQSVSGAAKTYATPTTTAAPTLPSSALTLTMGTVTLPSNANGSSQLYVQLIDPYAKAVASWPNVTSAQQLTYNAPAAAAGSYTWKFYGTSTISSPGSASFTLGYTATAGWYQAATTLLSASASAGAELQPVGFSFGVGTPNGSGYVTVNDGAQIFLEEPDDIDATTNWYLRMHRGWLSFTDPNANTFLVGLAPYYEQNFTGVIPLIAVDKEVGVILDDATIQIRHRPILWSPDYPVDIIVQRGTQELWLTRQNGLSSGTYSPQAILDCHAEAGQFVLANALFQTGDIVQVSYTYLEYYYTYRGMPDSFGRFVHLDVNPSAPHTYMNLWNIQNTNVGYNSWNSATQTIGASGGTINAPRAHTKTIAPSGTAILSTATGAPVVTAFSQYVNFTPSLSVIASTMAGTGIATHNINGNGVATISLIPTLTIAQILNNEIWGYSGVAKTTLTGGSPTTASGSNNGLSISTPSIGAKTTTVNKRTSTGLIPWNYQSQIFTTNLGPYDSWTHTWSPPGPQLIANIPTVVIPDTPGSAINITFSSLYMPTTGINFYMNGDSLYPYNILNARNAILNGNGLTCGSAVYRSAPEFKLYWQLNTNSGIALATGVISDYKLDAYANLGDQSFTVWSSAFDQLPAGSLISGSLNLQIWHQPDVPGQVSNGVLVTPNVGIIPALPLTWTDDMEIAYTQPPQGGSPTIANPILYSQGKVNLSSIQASSATRYTPIAGATQQYHTPKNTVAPTTNSTALTLNLSNVVTPSDSHGSSFYEVQLRDPMGNNVQVWHNITAANNPTLSYHAAGAVAGSYNWVIFASCTSTGTGTGSYPCTANVSWNWTASTTSTGTRVAGTGTTYQWTTPALVTAPASSGFAITASVSGMRFDSNAHGYAELSVVLTDAMKNTCGSWTITAASASTLSYWATGATAGAYTWHVTTIAMPAGTGKALGAYAATGTINFGYWLLQSISTYSPQVNGGNVQYRTDANTLAPTSSGQQLSFTLTAQSLPYDYIGSSTLTVQLLDPNAVQLGSWTPSTGVPLTYWNAAAIAGIYTWKVSFSCVSTGVVETDQYTIRWSGSYANSQSTSSTVYSASPPVSGVYVLPAATLAPTGSAVQLSFAINEIFASSDTDGSTYFSATLLNPSSGVVGTWTNITTPQTLTYSATGAVGGAYSWIVIANVTPTGLGPGTYSPVLQGQFFSYRLTSTTYVTETPGATQSYIVPSLSPGTYPLTMRIGAISSSSGVGTFGITLPSVQTYFLVTLANPSGTIVATWNQISQPKTLTYSTAGASGNWTWSVTAEVTNNNSATGSYPSAMLASLGWTQNDSVPSKVYYAPPFQTYSYPTSAQTNPPITPATQLTLAFTDVNLPSDAYGSTALSVSLYNSSGGLVQNWTVGSAQTLVYYSTGAAAGAYTWKVQPFITLKKPGTSTYTVIWSVAVGYTAPIDDEVPTVVLTQMAVYLYLTVEGRPFHAVLTTSNNPQTPLAYDTNKAMAGTRYAQVPTIHAF